MYQISLFAAFIAGMVALFAPCCITYLLPAYLGNIFREKKQIIFMTLIYSLGIFVVMLPVVLGAKALSMLFFELHDQTYLVGGTFMIFVGFISFLGIKFPMPNLTTNRKLGGDVTSTFILGIFSGITSACCAPVLIGVITLSSLTPSLLQSVGVGAAYVLGMVTPLYIASAIIEKKNILEKPILKKRLRSINFLGREYPIFVSNVVAGAIFALTGILMISLTLTGNLGMSTAEASITQKINNIALSVSQKTGDNLLVNLGFAAIALYFLYKFIKGMKKNKKEDTHTHHYTCPMHPEIKQNKKGNCPECGMFLVKKKKLKND